MVKRSQQSSKQSLPANEDLSPTNTLKKAKTSNSLEQTPSQSGVVQSQAVEATLVLPLDSYTEQQITNDSRRAPVQTRAAILKAARRQNETEEQKQTRLGLAAERKRQRRAIETEPERLSRLQTAAANSRLWRANSSKNEVQRIDRLRARGIRERRRRANEAEEERMSRLQHSAANSRAWRANQIRSLHTNNAQVFCFT
ncbi:unnamed protein product [Cylicocyclus nassatus]|uniref:Uncharacterized protein n=1 Tax=Cylicocyclus nassatus TaxID=53992 RepID=A0AA36H6L7_CYLNA|nr:unnamed protein product [Cylicocyclus nassatus]